MKKAKIVVTLLMVIMLSILMQSKVKAVGELGINVTSNKTKVENEAEVELTVKLSEGMQAADFYLEYDGSKLEYVSAENEEMSKYMGVNNGKLVVAWFSSSNEDKTEFKIKFKGKEAGETEIKLVPKGFATGKLEKPTSYKVTYGENGESESIKLTVDKTRPVGDSKTGESLVIIAIVGILLMAVFIVKKKLNQMQDIK